MVAERGHLVVVNVELVWDVDAEPLLCDLGKRRTGRLSDSVFCDDGSGSVASDEDYDDTRAGYIILPCGTVLLFGSWHILLVSKTGLRQRYVLDHSPFGEGRKKLTFPSSFLFGSQCSLRQAEDPGSQDEAIPR